MEAIEVLADIDRAVAELPPEYKLLVTHWKVEARSVEEIVKLYRYTPETAQRKLVRATYLMAKTLGWTTKEAK